jgi:hypothetical protein
MKFLFKLIVCLGLLSSNLIAQEKGLPEFLNLMGRIEGLGSYTTVSKSGYLGKYQFHPKTIRSYGFRVSRSEFLSNPELQDSIMVTSMRTNAQELAWLIRRKAGTYHQGIFISKAGILAGAHLMGTGGVLAFFYPIKYSYRTVDGNGVPIGRYIKKFAHYHLREL